MKRTARRAIGLPLSILYFATQVALPQAAEAHVWAERRRAAHPSQRNVQLASRSISRFAIPFSAVSPLPSALTLPSTLPSSLRRLAESVPASAGRLAAVHDAKSARPPVLIIQDVHLHAEAQANIASALQSLIDAGVVSAVGVEGVFSDIDFSRLRTFPDRAVLERVAGGLLTSRQLAAPSYVGLTSASTLPRFVGLDDADLYRANVRAYLDSKTLRARTEAALDREAADLQSRMERDGSADLIEFNRLADAYHAGRAELSAYARFLVRGESPTGQIGTFLEAAELEASLDFARAERERAQVLRVVSERLSESQLSSLLSMSLAHRAGEMGFGAYYGAIERLCRDSGVDLSRTPAFAAFLRYALLTDELKPEELLEAVRARERERRSAVARTPEEREWADRAASVRLARKLVRFELTPGDWADYQSLPHRAPPAFEDFYRIADERTDLMAERIDDEAGPMALVVGGFHTPVLEARLRRQGRSYLVFTPRVTRMGESTGSYLSVFDRDARRLEDLFKGERLFINPHHVNLPVAADRTRALLLHEGGKKDPALRSFDGAVREDVAGSPGVVVITRAGERVRIGRPGPEFEAVAPTPFNGEFFLRPAQGATSWFSVGAAVLFHRFFSPTGDGQKILNTAVFAVSWWLEFVLALALGSIGASYFSGVSLQTLSGTREAFLLAVYLAGAFAALHIPGRVVFRGGERSLSVEPLDQPASLSPFRTESRRLTAFMNLAGLFLLGLLLFTPLAFSFLSGPLSNLPVLGGVSAQHAFMGIAGLWANGFHWFHNHKRLGSDQDRTARRAAPYVESAGVVALLGPFLLFGISSSFGGEALWATVAAVILSDLLLALHWFATGFYVPDRRTGRFRLVSSREGPPLRLLLVFLAIRLALHLPVFLTYVFRSGLGEYALLAGYAAGVWAIAGHALFVDFLLPRFYTRHERREIEREAKRQEFILLTRQVQEASEFYGQLRSPAAPDSSFRDRLGKELSANSLAGLLRFADRYTRGRTGGEVVDDFVIVNLLYPGQGALGQVEGLGTKDINDAAGMKATDTVREEQNRHILEGIRAEFGDSAVHLYTTHKTVAFGIHLPTLRAEKKAPTLATAQGLAATLTAVIEKAEEATNVFINNDDQLFRQFSQMLDDAEAEENLVTGITREIRESGEVVLHVRLPVYGGLSTRSRFADLPDDPEDRAILLARIDHQAAAAARWGRDSFLNPRWDTDMEGFVREAVIPFNSYVLQTRIELLDPLISLLGDLGLIKNGHFITGIREAFRKKDQKKLRRLILQAQDPDVTLVQAETVFKKLDRFFGLESTFDLFTPWRGYELRTQVVELALRSIAMLEALDAAPAWDSNEAWQAFRDKNQKEIEDILGRDVRSPHLSSRLNAFRAVGEGGPAKVLFAIDGVGVGAQISREARSIANIMRQLVANKAVWELEDTFGNRMMRMGRTAGAFGAQMEEVQFVLHEFADPKTMRLPATVGGDEYTAVLDAESLSEDVIDKVVRASAAVRELRKGVVIRLVVAPTREYLDRGRGRVESFALTGIESNRIGFELAKMAEASLSAVVAPDYLEAMAVIRFSPETDVWGWKIIPYFTSTEGAWAGPSCVLLDSDDDNQREQARTEWVDRVAALTEDAGSIIETAPEAASLLRSMVIKPWQELLLLPGLAGLFGLLFVPQLLSFPPFDANVYSNLAVASLIAGVVAAFAHGDPVRGPPAAGQQRWSSFVVRIVAATGINLAAFFAMGTLAGVLLDPVGGAAPTLFDLALLGFSFFGSGYLAHAGWNSLIAVLHAWLGDRVPLDWQLSRPEPDPSDVLARRLADAAVAFGSDSRRLWAEAVRLINRAEPAGIVSSSSKGSAPIDRNRVASALAAELDQRRARGALSSVDHDRLSEVFAAALGGGIAGPSATLGETDAVLATVASRADAERVLRRYPRNDVVFAGAADVLTDLESLPVSTGRRSIHLLERTDADTFPGLVTRAGVLVRGGRGGSVFLLTDEIDRALREFRALPASHRVWLMTGFRVRFLIEALAIELKRERLDAYERMRSALIHA